MAASSWPKGDVMSGILRARAALLRSKISSAALLALFGSFVLTQVGGQALEAVDPLPYARGYLLTGNYVASGIDFTEALNPPNADGLSTGTIHITKCAPPAVVFNCVPDDADIVAAYLYWETIVPTADTTLAAGVRFRGEEILLNDVIGVRASHDPLVGSTASCWSSGSPLTIVEFRADVLRFLPVRLDEDNQPTGKRLVTDTDLANHGHPLNDVVLPTRTGNQVPESAGASLVIVYRDPAEPLRKIVFYDGIHIQAAVGDTMTQRLRGFYKSADAASAKVTHIIGSGQPNNNERLFFDRGESATTNTPISPIDPMTIGSSSQRGWSTLTYDVSTLMSPTTDLTGFGESVTTSLRHTPASGGYDCLAWGAVIFSTAVADFDQDGLPDGLEDSSAGLKDPPTPAFPTGQPLPNLNLMGAKSRDSAGSPHKDLFIEFNAMQTTAAKPHGREGAPYPGVTSAPWTTSVPAHTHLPTPEVLKLMADAYVARGITPHFDVGNIDDYHDHGLFYDPSGVISHPDADWEDDYTSDVADDFLVPTGLAKGGEVVDERACDETVATCEFAGYPGTVSWKVGLQLYRDAPVGPNGEELVTPEPPAGWDGRRRFDRNRRGLFHYVLYAHYRGKRMSELPCRDTSTTPPTPVGYTSGTSCSGVMNIEPNPEFNIPSSASGVADLPGGNAMVTLGFWDEFVGTPFVRASTTFHELGHNFNLWHGGKPAQWGNQFLNTTSFIEPNCKPNYLSVMSYLFQAHGLFDDADNIHLDFSGSQQADIAESSTPGDVALAAVPLPGVLYRTAWYAPAGSALAGSLSVSSAKRFCMGQSFATGTDPGMARVYNELAADRIDWNGDGDDTNNAIANQDLNFDNAQSVTLTGFSDWDRLRLDQIGAGRNAVKFQEEDVLDWGSGDFLDFGSGDFLDFGSGDFLDFGSGDFLDFGSGDFLDFGSGALLGVSGIHDGDFLDFGSGDFLDFGSGDFLDFGSGDFLDFGSGSERQELDFQAAQALGKGAPFATKACVIETTSPPSPNDCATAPRTNPADRDYHAVNVSYKRPPFGAVLQYEVARKRASDAWPDPPVVLAPPSTTLTFTDRTQLPDGVQFMYRARAKFTDLTFSGFSKPASIIAKNEAPVPTLVTLGYTMPAGATSLLGNVVTDNAITDVDSPSWVLSLVTPPARGALTFATSGATMGAFTYTPAAGFTGSDTFTYVATNGTWTDGTTPMNALTGPTAPTPVTVTINVPLTYGFLNVQNLPPPAGKTFKRGSNVTTKWRFTIGGVAVDSSAAGPVLVFTGPGGLVATYSQQEPGHSLFKPPTASNGWTWQFNWQTINEVTLQALPVGDYSVQIRITQTNQTFPSPGQAPIVIELVK
jgi:hypothetical protein